MAHKSNPKARRNACHEVSELLSRPRGELAELLASVRGLTRLERALTDVLDPTVCAHVRVASLEHGVLTLVADSPAWATRLRYLVPVVGEALARRGDPAEPVRSVRIVARPTDDPRPMPPPRRALMSRHASETLERTAQTIQDPALRAVLMRLARREED